MAVAAKKIQVSADNTTFYTLPGNTGQFSDQNGELDDTVFGQEYKSGFPGLGNWKVTSNALFKGFAGYNATIKKQGTTTTFTGEACTNVSMSLPSSAFRITNAVKSLWDHSVPIVVHDGATNITNLVSSYDYLFGIINFTVPYTPITAVTVTGSYFPLLTLGGCKDYTLTQQQAAVDSTTLAGAQADSAYSTFAGGLKTVSLDTKGIFVISNAAHALLQARAELIIELCPDGGGASVARGFFRCTSDTRAGNVGAIETEDLKFVLSVPALSLLETPFDWQFTNSTLSTGVQVLLNAFLNGTNVYVNYLPDGTNGITGQAVITDISLSGGTESMNTFTVQFQGSGQTTGVGTDS